MEKIIQHADIFEVKLKVDGMIYEFYSWAGNNKVTVTREIHSLDSQFTPIGPYEDEHVWPTMKDALQAFAAYLEGRNSPPITDALGAASRGGKFVDMG